MQIELTLTTARAHALLTIVEAANLRTLPFDARERRAAQGAVDALADALDGAVPDALDVELAALADLLGEVQHTEAAALFAGRVHTLLAQVEAWRALESAGRRAVLRGDTVMVERCEALAVPERIDEPGWGEAVAWVVARVAEAAPGGAD
jgi:hypothetical protein